jgi:hypothetical protein
LAVSCGVGVKGLPHVRQSAVACSAGEPTGLEEGAESGRLSCVSTEADVAGLVVSLRGQTGVTPPASSRQWAT